LAAEARLEEHATSAERAQSETARAAAAADARRVAAGEAADRLAAFLAAEEAARADAARAASVPRAGVKLSAPPRSMRQPRSTAAYGVGSPGFRHRQARSRPANVAIFAVAVLAGRVLWRVVRG
jgi:hypothetical protein